jgi:hypothetical protein
LYEVDVLDGAALIRTIRSSVPTITYTAAEQTADFGSPQPTIHVRIHQISATWGRGTARDALV